MTTQTEGRPTFWGTVRLLLGASRKRSDGRRMRQQQLMQNRSAGRATDWSGVGFALFVVFMFVLNGFAAFVLQLSVETAQRVEVERQGKIVVSASFLRFAEKMAYAPWSSPDYSSNLLHSSAYEDEAKRISKEYGGSPSAIEQKLRDAVQNRGTMDLVTTHAATPGLKALALTGAFPAMIGSLVLLWWGVMLAFQGEGLEMDTQRRRHPMWEWLFSHPVQPGAVFLAEMLSPIAANPMYWAGPLFPGIVYGLVYGPASGFIAAVAVGVPLTVAAACLGKALEIGMMLRLSPRSRGATIGLMSWLGYTSMMLFLLGLYFVPRLITAAGRFLEVFTAIPWPWLGLFLGARSDGSYSFFAGVLACWVAAGVVIAAAVWFSAWATQKGLTGNFASDAPGPSAANKRARFGREPLYRKEFLWFTRDRSALVQTLLVPITVAGVQVFNLRGILVHAESAWNYLCGVAIFFGTYFLWILGPKSLQSEGTALWIALTWPRGLENLLKAKAWLWSMLSSGLVAIVLCYAAFAFPSEIWKIGLVGVGWFFFSRSMAEKSVTLVTITSSSGETEKVPMGRRWAAQLGMLTFAIGIVTGQWQLAIIGIVYSYLTAAAMWQNFRARLPYLYDPWSEKLPPPPTLMHSMISVSALVEVAAMVSVPILLIAGRENLAMAQAIGYGISAVVVSLFVSNFLRERNVRPQDIWCWLPDGVSIEECEPWLRRYGLGDGGVIPVLLLGAGGGLALGIFAHGYLAVLKYIPGFGELIRKSQEHMASIPYFHLWYAIMAVGFAPFAEEYLFRGLLFRALDREWGGWRAVVGSAAFFAIYHPPMSWLPVGLLGVANALLFKKTHRLAPSVLLHMVYNAVVLM
jgi:membrane protease YdiL (CAAX protease family)